jgi:hypothetical protein
MHVSHTSSPVEQTVMATVRVVHAQQATFWSQKKKIKVKSRIFAFESVEH